MDEFINREIAEFQRRYKLPASIPAPEFSIPQPTPAQEVAHVQPMPRAQISKWKLPVIQLTCGQPSESSGSAEELPDSTESDYSGDYYESDYSETETESEDDYQNKHTEFMLRLAQQMRAKNPQAPKSTLNLFKK